MKCLRWIIFGIIFVLAACSPKGTTLKIEMSEFRFSPDHLMVKAGQPVTLDLKNSGALEHDLLILELGEQGHTPFKEDQARVYWKARLDARQEQVLQFLAPAEPGEYVIVCGVPGHLEQKMHASLTVAP